MTEQEATKEKSQVSQTNQTRQTSQPTGLMLQTTHFGYQEIPIEEKTGRVGKLFSAVSDRYDLMNDLMSFGLHRLWKRQAIACLNVEPYHRVLDLAAGTGDMTKMIVKKLSRSHSPSDTQSQNAEIIMSDINEAMLIKGRARLIDEGLCHIQYAQSNAEALPFPDQYFDRAVMSFGLRNVTYKDKALSELCRVIKPGGRLVILEFSSVKNPLLSKLYDGYSFSVLPRLGKVICQDAESYRYLAESIRKHPGAEELKTMLLSAGFDRVTYQLFHQGIVALHIGYKDSRQRS